MPPGVLFNVMWDHQQCMAPLMWLDRDEFMEASLLGPTDDRIGGSPTLEEEVVLLGEELEPQEDSGGYYIPPEAQKSPNLKNHMSSLTLQIHLALCP